LFREKEDPSDGRNAVAALLSKLKPTLGPPALRNVVDVKPEPEGAQVRHNETTTPEDVR
jgi:hypothetical protein